MSQPRDQEAEIPALQRTRELSVRRKLNAMPAVFKDKSVLLVDDSIVRGTTMSQIVDMVRRAGAKKVKTAGLLCKTECPHSFLQLHCFAGLKPCGAMPTAATRGVCEQCHACRFILNILCS